MARRRRFLVTYDIRDGRRLRRVHKAVSGRGDPLQYSVFLCDLTRGELVELKQSLRDLIEPDIDNVSIFDLGSPSGDGAVPVEHLGQRPTMPGGDVFVF